jgi:hypothetical protein
VTVDEPGELVDRVANIGKLVMIGGSRLKIGGIPVSVDSEATFTAQCSLILRSN